MRGKIVWCFAKKKLISVSIVAGFYFVAFVSGTYKKPHWQFCYLGSGSKGGLVFYSKQLRGGSNAYTEFC